MSSLIRLRTEPCSICKKTLALSIPANQLQPDVTGLDLFLDLHGIDDEQSHSRLLYVDTKGRVRNMVTITKFATLLQKDAPSEE
ncbi:MAG: hypothetical protein JSU57_00320 [Candidatus Heimdallarchaeota archaeon]|nr:MAG: hypothetical protein JSU57_00320 [Candidatus Heimdallarchaeota archaeon]